MDRGLDKVLSGDISFIDPEIKEIPLEIPLIDTDKEPLRWWSVKTVMSYLGVSERQIRRYLKSGKLEKKYRTVKGHNRVYVSNQSAISLKYEINKKHYKEPAPEPEDEADELEDQYWNTRLAKALLSL